MTHTNRPHSRRVIGFCRQGLARDASRSLSVGGLAADLGLLPSAKMGVQTAFSRLVEYCRRKMGLWSSSWPSKLTSTWKKSSR